MPSASRISIALLCAGAFAFACSPRSHSEAASATTLASAAPVTLQALPRPASRSPRLTASFDVKVRDNVVQFALDVTNQSKKHVELTFPNGQTHEFVVVDSLGHEVWRWGATRLFTQSVTNKLLGGGETMRVSERWERPALHGKYTAIGTITSTNFPVEERADFVLP